MTACVAVGGPLEAPFVGLYTAINAPLSPDLALSNVTEATYDGYARQAVGTWAAPFVDGTGRVQVQGDAREFRPTGSVTPNVIIGWFLASLVAAGTLRAIEPLDTPVPLNSTLTVLTVIPRFGLLRSWSFGEGVEIN
jgi:hypothetical protein